MLKHVVNVSAFRARMVVVGVELYEIGALGDTLGETSEKEVH